jgi:hypothetical protein
VISYGKAPHFRLILTWTGASLRHCRVYGALTWRTIWNARHVPDQGAILHAVDRASIRGVKMACNTAQTALVLPIGERDGSKSRLGNLACNTLPYKIAALREAHRAVRSWSCPRRVGECQGSCRLSSVMTPPIDEAALLAAQMSRATNL